MKLVMAVVQGKDVEGLMLALRSANYRATQINSSGGFLRENNVTIMTGVQDSQWPPLPGCDRHDRGEPCRTTLPSLS